jgi:hypothetical protein
VRLKKAYLGGKEFSLAIMNSLDKSCIVPIFYHIVRSIVDLNLDGVTSVIDQENYTVLFLTEHGGNILARHLQHRSLRQQLVQLTSGNGQLVH